MITHNLRTLLCTSRAVFAIVATVIAAATAQGESSKVVSVEEHWELQISEPDSERSAPQTTMVMSPNHDVTGMHFLFTLNHVTLPEYQPGGMQVQAWDGDNLSQEKAGSASAALQNSGETVRWTQRLSLHDATLTFQVADAQS